MLVVILIYSCNPFICIFLPLYILCRALIVLLYHTLNVIFWCFVFTICFYFLFYDSACPSIAPFVLRSPLLICFLLFCLVSYCLVPYLFILFLSLSVRSLLSSFSLHYVPPLLLACCSVSYSGLYCSPTLVAFDLSSCNLSSSWPSCITSPPCCLP